MWHLIGQDRHNCAGRGVSADGNPSRQEALSSVGTAWNHGSWKGGQRDQVQPDNLSQGKKIQAFPGLVLEVCVSKDSIQNSFEITWKEHLQSPHNSIQNAIFLYW